MTSSHAHHPKKIFTIEQANAVLPLVKAIARDWQQLTRDVTERRERLWHLSANRPSGARDMYSEELAQIEEELDKDTSRLGDFVNELRELGVEPKDGSSGLVDFPAIIDGRLVLLCWKLGEPEVLFWHDLDAGFRGRQPLTADSVAEGSDSDATGSDLHDEP